jgi:hypothetical protein
MSIIFDAMDQSKCSVPHFCHRAKSWVGNKKKLQMQYGSFIVHGHGTYGVAWDERITKNGDMWETMLLKIILELYQKYKDEGTPWPETLYLQADNASDNKNLSLYALCQLLRDLGIFKRVKLCFLPVGHTHEDVDASFGALARKLNDNDAYTFEEVEKLWKEVWPGFQSFRLLTVSKLTNALSAV